MGLRRVRFWGAPLLIGALAVLAEENRVRNPGFEEVDASGATVGWPARPPAYRAGDGCGRDGTRGLAYENADPAFYAVPSRAVQAEAGRCYAFEVWVRTEGLAGEESGATVCMEWSDAAGRYLGGAYPAGVRGTSDGWRRVSGVTPPLPEAAARVTVAPYVRRGMTGRAWFDDLSVTRHVPPPVSAVSVSSYRRMSAGGEVTFWAGLRLTEAGLSAGEVEGVFTLVSAGGGEAVRTAKPDALAADLARWTVDVSALPPGEYRVRFGLAARGGGPLGEASARFLRVAELPPRRVQVDGLQRLVVEGKPFFPLGMYWSGVKEAELDAYAKGPFNCLMPYGSPDRAQMDACHARGLKVIYSLKDLYAGTQWAPKGLASAADEEAEVRRRVALHRGHPALLAWYINDELPLSMVERLEARQRLMEELDPDHPTWVVLYQYSQVRSYMGTFDVIGTDPYPIPGKPAGTALEWTRVTREQSYGARPLWQVPQVFDWGAYKTGAERDKTRAPTLAEMRAMAWQCVAGGANGLVFYSYFDLRKMASRDPFERRWAEVCAVAEEVRRYTPVILSDGPAPEVRCDAPASVAVRAWRVGRTVYLLAVNGAEAAVTARLSLPGRFAETAVEFGPAPERETGGGGLVVRLEPLEPALLRLEE